MAIAAGVVTLLIVAAEAILFFMSRLSTALFLGLSVFGFMIWTAAWGLSINGIVVGFDSVGAIVGCSGAW